MAADDPIGLIRHTDLARIEQTGHETMAAVNKLDSTLTELRIDLAKNYATKLDLLEAIREARREDAENDKAIASDLRDHLAADEKRFGKLEKMLWWVIGLMGTGLLGVIYVLVTAALGHPTK